MTDPRRKSRVNRYKTIFLVSDAGLRLDLAQIRTVNSIRVVCGNITDDSTPCQGLEIEPKPSQTLKKGVLQ